MYGIGKNFLPVRIRIQIFPVRDRRRLFFPVVITLDPHGSVFRDDLVQPFFGKVRDFLFGIPRFFIDEILSVRRVHAVFRVHRDARIPRFAVPLARADESVFPLRREVERRFIRRKREELARRIGRFPILFLQGLRQYVLLGRSELRRPLVSRRIGADDLIYARVYGIDCFSVRICPAVHGYAYDRGEPIGIAVFPRQHDVAVRFPVDHVGDRERFFRPVDDDGVMLRGRPRLCFRIERVFARLVVFDAGDIFFKRIAPRPLHETIPRALETDMPGVGIAAARDRLAVRI